VHGQCRSHGVDLLAATTDPIAIALEGFHELVNVGSKASRSLTPLVIA
jgi:hypothetical protein